MMRFTLVPVKNPPPPPPPKGTFLRSNKSAVYTEEFQPSIKSIQVSQSTENAKNAQYVWLRKLPLG